MVRVPFTFASEFEMWNLLGRWFDPRRWPAPFRLERWKAEMTTDELCGFKQVAGPLLAELGYELAAREKSAGLLKAS